MVLVAPPVFRPPQKLTFEITVRPGNRGQEKLLRGMPTAKFSSRSQIMCSETETEKYSRST